MAITFHHATTPTQERRRRHLHRSILAVTFLASQTHVNALVYRANPKSRAHLPNFFSHHRHVASTTALHSIGDPERNSDRERRSRDRLNKSDDDNGRKRRRRKNANGKYSRRRQSSQINDDKKNNNNPPDGKTNESKIKTSTNNNSLQQFSSSPHPAKQFNNDPAALSNMTMDGLKKRVVQLETLISSQMSEMQKLRREIDDMSKSLNGVVSFVEQLQDYVHDDDTSNQLSFQQDTAQSMQQPLLQEEEIFGIAPTTIKDAADSAGQSILSAILAGKQRMLVDVRDAELTRDPALLVEFIELSILPVAAGLQGLDDTTRIKIVFPTITELLSYRKYMALASQVVALSTLGFVDPIEEQDHLIVVVAPTPDDVGGCDLMNRLLEKMGSTTSSTQVVSRPVVVINHHMMPLDSRVGKFTVVYHLRLLSVQYMTGDIGPEYVERVKDGDEEEEESEEVSMVERGEGDSALEAAMTHAREIGVHQGVTRAMVIRAYPKPWHVFVDVSPDTDADFEVAATFDSEPTQEDVNYSIVECLEGSEREDELVAKQMQEALDAGQLTRVSEMLGISPNSIAESMGLPSSDTMDDGKSTKSDDWDDLYYDDWFNEDSV